MARHVEIYYHSYNCHPETCCHDNHDNWFIVDSKTGSFIGKRESKEEAIKSCELLNIPYTVKESSWADRYYY